MKTYFKQYFPTISSILMQAAQGVSAVCGSRLVISDMIYSLSDFHDKSWNCIKEPYYIAIREQGTESGYKENCIERCKNLGYPIIIAKIEKDKVCDYNMTIMLTQNRDYTKMEQEFNSL